MTNSINQEGLNIIETSVTNSFERLNKKYGTNLAPRQFRLKGNEAYFRCTGLTSAGSEINDDNVMDKVESTLVRVGKKLGIKFQLRNIHFDGDGFYFRADAASTEVAVVEEPVVATKRVKAAAQKTVAVAA